MILRTINLLKKLVPNVKTLSYHNHPFSLSLPLVPSSEAKEEFLGNGEWPMSSVPVSRTTSDPLSPTETVDFNPKMAYKMTARPRGVAIIINNRHFTCGMKERIGKNIQQ